MPEQYDCIVGSLSFGQLEELLNSQEKLETLCRPLPHVTNMELMRSRTKTNNMEIASQCVLGF